MLNIAVFFYPRKLKMPKKPFLSLFLFFFSIENIFLAHFHNILSGILKFSDGWIFFFSLRKKNFKVFFFFDGIHFYFLSWDSFFSCEILLFFLWHILLLGQFSNLCLGQFEIFSDRKCYIFLKCFLSGNIFQNYVPLPVCYSFLIFIKKYPLIHTYPYVPFLKN